MLGSYSQVYRRGNVTSSQYSAERGEALMRSRRMQQETTRRRRDQQAKRNDLESQEEDRRQAILEERRRNLAEITDKYQRLGKKRTQSASTGRKRFVSPDPANRSTSNTIQLERALAVIQRQLAHGGEPRVKSATTNGSYVTASRPFSTPGQGYSQSPYSQPPSYPPPPPQQHPPPSQQPAPQQQCAQPLPPSQPQQQQKAQQQQQFTEIRRVAAPQPQHHQPMPSYVQTSPFRAPGPSPYQTQQQTVPQQPSRPPPASATVVYASLHNQQQQQQQQLTIPAPRQPQAVVNYQSFSAAAAASQQQQQTHQQVSVNSQSQQPSSLHESAASSAVSNQQHEARDTQQQTQLHQQQTQQQQQYFAPKQQQQLPEDAPPSGGMQKYKSMENLSLTDEEQEKRGQSQRPVGVIRPSSALSAQQKAALVVEDEVDDIMEDSIEVRRSFTVDDKCHVPSGQVFQQKVAEQVSYQSPPKSADLLPQSHNVVVATATTNIAQYAKPVAPQTVAAPRARTLANKHEGDTLSTLISTRPYTVQDVLTHNHSLSSLKRVSSDPVLTTAEKQVRGILRCPSAERSSKNVQFGQVIIAEFGSDGVIQGVRDSIEMTKIQRPPRPTKPAVASQMIRVEPARSAPAARPPPPTPAYQACPVKSNVPAATRVNEQRIIQPDDKGGGVREDVKLEQTPTDAEINWLWEKVRETLNRPPSSGAGSAKSIASSASRPTGPRPARSGPAQQVIDGSALTNNRVMSRRRGDTSESTAQFVAAERAALRGLEPPRMEARGPAWHQATPPSALSIEEAQIMASLDRINTQLRLLPGHGQTIPTENRTNTNGMLQNRIFVRRN